MLFGQLPFDGKDEAELELQIKDKEIQLDFDDVPISDELRALFADVLCRDPAKRPSMAQAIEKHEWLTPPQQEEIAFTIFKKDSQ